MASFGRGCGRLRVPDFVDPWGLAVAPDGRTVFAALTGYDNTDFDGLATFRRSGGGTLRQLRYRAGCIAAPARFPYSPSRRGCALGRGLSYVSEVDVSPDGRTVLATSGGSMAVFRWRRR